MTMRTTRALLVVLAFLGTYFGLLATATAAHAATQSRRVSAFYWAKHQLGCPYEYGHTGPCNNGFDCSGLVMRAWRHVGVGLPRTTGEMLRSWHLVHIHHRNVHRGDLAFYGSGHVELVQWSHTTLGAPEPGEVVRITRWHWNSWHPTKFFRIVG
jgi:cell wall-associated NlpC family hydrolase